MLRAYVTVKIWKTGLCSCWDIDWCNWQRPTELPIYGLCRSAIWAIHKHASILDYVGTTNKPWNTCWNRKSKAKQIQIAAKTQMRGTSSVDGPHSWWQCVFCCRVFASIALSTWVFAIVSSFISFQSALSTSPATPTLLQMMPMRCRVVVVTLRLRRTRCFQRQARFLLEPAFSLFFLSSRRKNLVFWTIPRANKYLAIHPGTDLQRWKHNPDASQDTIQERWHCVPRRVSRIVFYRKVFFVFCLLFPRYQFSFVGMMKNLAVMKDGLITSRLIWSNMWETIANVCFKNP